MREIRQGRDELTGSERAVADVLDEWLARFHGSFSASAYQDWFITDLRQRGYKVVPLEPEGNSG